jgi:hypothetical protein
MIRSGSLFGSSKYKLGLMAWLMICGFPVPVADAAVHEAGSAHEASHEFHRNTLGLFVGVTDEGREEAVTLGIEYERRLNKSFGIGLFAEYLFGDADFWVYGVPFTYHNRQWTFYIGPGVEDGKHGSEYFARIGGQYSFEAGSWEISPQMNVDFVDGEEVYVLGIVFGKGF